MSKKLLTMIVLLALLLCGCNPTSANPSNSPAVQKTQILTPRQVVMQYVENVYKNNYTPFYNVQTVSLTFVSESFSNKYTATVLMKVTKTLKYNSVDTIPYVQGMLSAINLKSYPYTLSSDQKIALIRQKNPLLNNTQAMRATTYLDKTYDELTRYIGKSYDAYMFLYVSAPLTATKGISASALTVLVEQPHYERVNLLSFKPSNAQTMTKQGTQDIEDVITGKIIPQSKPAYDPWKVVQYADKYTSNSTKVCPGTTVYSDPTKWNNSTWTYQTSLCADDCADFASQALNFAGLSVEPKKWQRLKDGANGWPWTSTSGLRNYLLNQRKAARLVEPWQIRAGGIISTNKGHTMIVVRNDTIETLTDAHTNDRYHEPLMLHTDWYYLNNW
jgi:RNA polymerase sigma-70 factor (ECF subfamily)